MEDVITENLRGFGIKFKTRPGVFSKNGLDEGTKLLAEEVYLSDGSLVADLGSGSGVLGFVLAKLNPRGHVHMLDDHLRSVELVKSNAELNGLRNVEVFLSDLFSAVDNRTYQQIVTNPPQQMGNEFLRELVEESFRHLKPKGELWLVVKSNVGKVLEREMMEVFGNVDRVARGMGHIVLKGVRSA